MTLKEIDEKAKRYWIEHDMGNKPPTKIKYTPAPNKETHTWVAGIWWPKDIWDMGTFEEANQEMMARTADLRRGR